MENGDGMFKKVKDIGLVEESVLIKEYILGKY